MYYFHVELVHYVGTEAENTSDLRWIKSKTKPKTMPMVRDNFALVRKLESYEKRNIKEGEGGKPKIQKVPDILRRDESNKCYDPMIVAIGPYHHGNKKLKQMEAFKIQFTLQYTHQSGKSIKELYGEMQKLLVEAKNYYAEDIAKDFNTKKFAEMMFLDSCFVIQFMYCCVKPEKNDIKTTYFDKNLIMRDILLLENQLPFKILTKLMSLSSKFDGCQGKEMIDDFIKLIMSEPPIKRSTKKEELFLVSPPKF